MDNPTEHIPLIAVTTTYFKRATEFRLKWWLIINNIEIPEPEPSREELEKLAISTAKELGCLSENY